MKIINQPVAIVAQQLALCPAMPSVIRPVEFTGFCACWERLDALLRAGVGQGFVMRLPLYAYTLQGDVRNREPK